MTTPSPTVAAKGVFAQVFDATGQAVTSRYVVESVTANSQYASTVAATSSGFVVEWTSYNGTADDVKAQAFSLDSAPVLGGAGGTTNLAGVSGSASAATAVASGLTVADSDNPTLSSASVSIGTGFHSAEDVLAFTNNGSTMGNIVGSYNSGTGVLTLTSSGATATLAQWQAALRSVTYADSSTSATAGDRTISYTVNDGTTDSAAVSQTLHLTVDSPPSLAGAGGTTNLAGVSGSASAATAVASGLTVADSDNTTLSSASVSIGTGFHSGEDVLAFTNNGSTMGNIVGSYNSGTGVLTLASSGATATLAQWQAALRAVTYADSSTSATAGDRTISYTVNDGTTDSAAVSQTLHLTVDSPPSLAGAGGTTNLIAAPATASSAVAIAPSLTVADSDNTTLSSASVSIGTGFHSGEDVLAFTNASGMGNIAGSYNSGTGVLTLTSSGATATLAQWQAALRAVTYADGSTSATAGDRTISFAVNDGTTPSTAASETLHFTIDAAPSLGSVPTSASLAIDTSTSHSPLDLAPGLTVADSDNTTLAAAYISIGVGFHSGQDVLAFANTSGMGNISGSYDSAAGLLTLTSSGATATLAQWQTALRAVTYDAAVAFPTAGDRAIGITVSDGVTTASTATETVHVTVTSPPPPPPPPSPPPPPPPSPSGPPTDGSDGQVTLGIGGHFTAGNAGDVIAGGGDDTMIGGAGNDEIYAGGSDNYIRGGAGNDGIFGSAGFDNINGNQGDDSIDGGAGGNDWLLGGQGSDQIVAHGGDNLLSGNLGSDTLTGGAGADTLRGGQGDDVLSGGAGADWLSGDLGDDTLTGGAGADTFRVFAGGGHDVITDFNAAEGDRILVDPGTHYTLSQSGSDVVIDLGGGGETVLKNVNLLTLPAGWIVGG